MRASTEERLVRTADSRSEPRRKLGRTAGLDARILTSWRGTGFITWERINSKIFKSTGLRSMSMNNAGCVSPTCTLF